MKGDRGEEEGKKRDYKKAKKEKENYVKGTKEEKGKDKRVRRNGRQKRGEMMDEKENSIRRSI